MSDGWSPALIERLRSVDRENVASLTSQLVEVFVAAIADGELPPGAKLPPTRALAALAGINQLTASRCYRRLQALGAVTSEVGRGTFVRAVAAGRGAAERSDDAAWQAYVLPAERVQDADL